MRFLVLNGPNLNLLGRREPGVYPPVSLAQLEKRLADLAAELGVEVSCQQHQCEGRLITALHEAADWADGVIFNPAAYTHYSIALRDAVAAMDIPVLEVHLTNTAAREPFRHISVISPVASGTIVGLGVLGYELALRALKDLARERG